MNSILFGTEPNLLVAERSEDAINFLAVRGLFFSIVVDQISELQLDKIQNNFCNKFGYKPSLGKLD